MKWCGTTESGTSSHHRGWRNARPSRAATTSAATSSSRCQRNQRWNTPSTQASSQSASAKPLPAESQAKTGTRVNRPATSGRPTRSRRCRARRRSPRACHSRALKKPLIRKNNGIRKPWMIEAAKAYPFRSSGVADTQSSCTGQKSSGRRNAAAWRTIPSSIAKLRRASRSWNRVKGGDGCRRNGLGGIVPGFTRPPACGQMRKAGSCRGEPCRNPGAPG